MKAVKFQTPLMNPLYRDLTLVLIASLAVSIAVVTVGYLVFVQMAGH